MAKIVARDAQVNANAIRQASTQRLTTAVVESRSAPVPVNLNKVTIPVKGGSADAEKRFLGGDPILQLDSSRNPVVRYTPALFNDEKAGDYATLLNDVEIQRLHPLRQEQNRNRAERLVELAIIENSASVKLNPGVNPHAIQALPRVKPALPFGRNDIPAPTQGIGYRNDLLMSKAPLETISKLDGEAVTARAAIPMPQTAVTQPYQSADLLSVNLAPIEKTTKAPESTSQSAGRVLFIAAALLVGYWVLASHRGAA